MEKVKQVQDTVPNLNKLTTEQLEHQAKKALVAYSVLNAQSKQTSTEKNAAKERAIPVLRAYRSRLSRRGNGEWQAWFEENKKDFGGVSVRSVNRWLGDKDEKPKFANLDSVDGISLAGKKYTIKVSVNGNSPVLNITATPYVKEKRTAEAQPEPEQETMGEPAKKLSAADTREAIAVFEQKYRDANPDKRTTVKWMVEYGMLFEAEQANHPEWRKDTARREQTRIGTAIVARRNAANRVSVKLTAAQIREVDQVVHGKGASNDDWRKALITVGLPKNVVTFEGDTYQQTAKHLVLGLEERIAALKDTVNTLIAKNKALWYQDTLSMSAEARELKKQVMGLKGAIAACEGAIRPVTFGDVDSDDPARNICSWYEPHEDERHGIAGLTEQPAVVS